MNCSYYDLQREAIKATFVGTSRSQYIYLQRFELFSYLHVWHRWYYDLITRCTKRNSRHFLHIWPRRHNQYCPSTARIRLAVVLVLQLRTRKRKSKNAKYLTAQLQYWYASHTKYSYMPGNCVSYFPSSHTTMTPDVLNKLIEIINWLINTVVTI